MVTLLIISLLSMAIATGTAFGVRQYRKAVTRSEARILCSTLSSILEDEFTNTQHVFVDGSGNVARYDSQRHGNNISLLVKDSDGTVVSSGGGGYLFAGNNELLSQAAYSKGFQNLCVESPELKYDNEAKFFTVTLTVTDFGKTQKVTTKFDVIPLNSVKTDDA